MNTNDTKQKISQIMASVKVGDVFATRLATVLKNGNIHTMDVLLGKSEVELLKLKDFGKGKLREVAEYFEQVGVGRPPYYDEFPWEAIRGGLKQKGYTEGAIQLFREMFWKSGIAPVRQKKEETQ